MRTVVDIGMWTRRVAQGAAFAPRADAISVMLLLPDRAGVLDRLDHLPAGAEGFVTMRRAGRDDHGHVAHRQASACVRDEEFQPRAEVGMRMRGDGFETTQASASNMS